MTRLTAEGGSCDTLGAQGTAEPHNPLPVASGAAAPRFHDGQHGRLPAIDALTLVVLVAANPYGLDKRARWLRRTAIVLVGVLVMAAMWATALLIYHLATGARVTEAAGTLLGVGALVLSSHPATYRSDVASTTSTEVPVWLQLGPRVAGGFKPSRVDLRKKV